MHEILLITTVSKDFFNQSPNHKKTPKIHKSLWTDIHIQCNSSLNILNKVKKKSMKCWFYSTNYFYFTVILLTNKMKGIYSHYSPLQVIYSILHIVFLKSFSWIVPFRRSCWQSVSWWWGPRNWGCEHDWDETSGGLDFNQKTAHWACRRGATSPT